jgi:hypothetical protein
MPEFRVYDKELKRRYTIAANSSEEIDPEVYDVLPDEATSDHLGPLAPEFNVTKTGRETTAPVVDGQSAATTKERS